MVDLTTYGGFDDLIILLILLLMSSLWNYPATFPWEENGKKDNLLSCSLLTVSIAPCKGFGNLGTFYCWIAEPRKCLLWIGIPGSGIRITVQWRRNPTNDWSPESKFLWKNPQFSTRNPEFTARNSDSKTVLKILLHGANQQVGRAKINQEWKNNKIKGGETGERKVYGIHNQYWHSLRCTGN